MVNCKIKDGITQRITNSASRPQDYQASVRIHDALEEGEEKHRHGMATFMEATLFGTLQDKYILDQK